MPVAEIIAIGTELLLGEIQDTNTRYLAHMLRDSGIDIYRAMIVGDNAERIAQMIREALQRADIVITTGGLGPTVDDPTRDAVALAVGVPTEFRPELWAQIEERFQRYGRKTTENNRRQAYVPQGALAVENPVGTAPAFIVEVGDKSVISLPGVPREMEYLTEQRVMPYLRNRFTLRGVIRSMLIHTAGVGESQLDEWVADLETLSNPTVGLAAHSGQVDVRITAKADSPEEAGRMLEEMAAVVHHRLGHAIYGVDAETLEGVTRSAMVRRGWRLALLECGLDQQIRDRLQKVDFPLAAAAQNDQPMEEDDLAAALEKLCDQSGADAGLAASLVPGGMKHTLTLVICTPTDSKTSVRSYGGPPANAPLWAVNLSLDALRRTLQE